MATVERFEDLRVWQLARGLVQAIYTATTQDAAGHSNPNTLALRNQLRRTAAAAMSLVAEGFERPTDGAFAHALDDARAVLTRVQSLLYVARDLGLLDDATFLALYDHARETARHAATLAGFLRNP